MADRVGQQLGNYRLIRLLGRGGFAEVYLGEHLRLNNQAAIKVLHAQLASSDEASFQNEARTIARLLHPHIVRVLDFDLQEGVPFLVMDYASNGTLRQRHPKGTLLPLATIVDYVKQIADALQYAHDEKLIHRDIKPENMLLGRRNEILLSDFGIATMTQSSRYQNTQEIVGTVAYMAPEQIQGKPRPASDQYALGVVVYEWLSGDLPFYGSFSEIATQHMFVHPPSLQEKVPKILPEVEQVVLTALEKDPHARFASIKAFANALEQASQLEQSMFSRPTLLVKPSILSEPTLPAVAPSVITPSDTPDKSSISPVPISTPPAVTPPGTQVRLPGSPEPTFVPHISTTLFTYRDHSRAVTSVAWSPDGTYIASASEDGTVQVWNSTTGDKVVTYRGHSKWVSAVAWLPDNKHVASASEDKTVQVWNAFTGSNVITFHGQPSWVQAIAVSPDGKRIVSAYRDDTGTIEMWDSNTGNKIITYRDHSNSVQAIAWSPDGMHIASGSKDSTVQVWEAATGKKIFTYRGHSWSVNALAWSPDGKRIVSASFDRTVQMWDVATGGNKVIYRNHTNVVETVAWFPDGKYIASGSADKTVQIWVVATRDKLVTYQGHSGMVTSIALSPDGTMIASASTDKTVQVWSFHEVQT